MSTALDRTLARLSADEMVSALGLASAPWPVRAAVRTAFRGISTPLGRVLARFDRHIESKGLAAAAAGALEDLGARWATQGATPPSRGPLLLVANHPGAYDALVLMAAVARDDVAIVAADRAFLRAMPGLSRHLILLSEAPGAVHERARTLRRAREHMASGGALLHFGAGRIEPDPAFARRDLLAPWSRGTGALVEGAARCRGAVVVAIVEGVHSPRAKRLLVTRLAERRGITTLAPLLQVAVPAYRDISARVRFAPAEDAGDLARRGDDAAVTAIVRSRAASLLGQPPPA